MYFFVYLFICSILPVFGWIIYRSIKKEFSIFFLIFTFSFTLWLVLYFLFFGNFFEFQGALLYLSRINFLTGLFGVYNILFFVSYYDSDDIPWKKILIPLAVILPVLGYVYIFTDTIIPGLTLDTETGAYHEIIGKYYHLTTGLYIIFLFLLIWNGWKKMQILSDLNKVRLRRILFSIYILMAVGIFLQLILPAYNIYIFEKEFIFLPVLFVVYTYFTLRKYYFNPVGVSNSTIFSFLLSAFSGVFAYGITIFLGIQGVSFGTYWQLYDPYNLSNVFVGILAFFITHQLIGRYIFRDNVMDEYKENLFLLEKKITEIYDLDILNALLGKEITQIFHIHDCSVELLSLVESPLSYSLQEYFESGYSDNIFINDIVFIEQKAKVYNKIYDLQKELQDTSAYIIFPLFQNEMRCIGYLKLGRKNLNDYYSQHEIRLLKKFSHFLSGHIRYIFTYRELQEFSQNLDKKVDEKTMEYNDLINKQKEFISTISHEIKSPIAAAILQTDSIIDDLVTEGIPQQVLEKELELLNMQLVKVGDLLSKLFSVQYYDTHSVTLFKEKVQIQNILNMELDIHEGIHSNIQFSREIDSNMRFIEIDRIQFQQVATNLLNNAIKFSDPSKPCIHVEASVNGNDFCFSVEDNGKGFYGIMQEDVFEKYAVGTSGSVGLGIGLYLCKRIVEMHGGSISASIGSILQGARIDIRIPL